MAILTTVVRPAMPSIRVPMSSAKGLWIALILLLLHGGPVASATTPLRAYEVKAVFLFNFTQFVAWPESSFTEPTAPFIIGVLGRDPFGKALDEAIRGETVNGGTLGAS